MVHLILLSQLASCHGEMRQDDDLDGTRITVSDSPPVLDCRSKESRLRVICSCLCFAAFYLAVNVPKKLRMYLLRTSTD